MKRVIITFVLSASIYYLGCAICSGKNFESINLKIVYNVFEDEDTNDYEIYTMNLDGSDKKNISNSKSIDWVYYTNEDKIYFVSDRDSTFRKYFLYEMDSNGNNIRKMSQFLVEDSWISSRKDGSEFVVSSNKDGQRHELYIMDRNGNEIKRLTDNEFYDNDPCFSPDGKQIVFRSRRTDRDELWMMDENGENLRQLTFYPENDSTAGKYGYHAGPPSWVSKHNIISFISKQNGNYSIFTIKPDGTNVSQLTTGKFDEGWHAWSPDGNYIVYDGTDENKNYDIYIMKADGSQVRRLTTDDKYEQAPSFVKIKSETK